MAFFESSSPAAFSPPDTAGLKPCGCVDRKVI
jgi:hypothetical protein